MNMTNSFKAALFAISAACYWVTQNLGYEFYILVAAYIINFALHYDKKQEFLQKQTMYLGSTFFAYYLQNTQQFLTIPLIHGLIVGLAAYESLEVWVEIKNRMEIYKTAHPNQANEINNIESALALIEKNFPGMTSTMNTQNSAPSGTKITNTMQGVDAK